MEKFHISERIKNNLVKLVREKCKNAVQYRIVYCAPTFTFPAEFNVIEMRAAEFLDSCARGECYYEDFTYCETATNAEIKKQIFGR